MKIGARFGRGGIHFLVRVTADRPLGRASIGFFHPGGYCIIFKLSTLCMHRSEKDCIAGNSWDFLHPSQYGRAETGQGTPQNIFPGTFLFTPKTLQGSKKLWNQSNVPIFSAMIGEKEKGDGVSWYQGLVDIRARTVIGVGIKRRWYGWCQGCHLHQPEINAPAQQEWPLSEMSAPKL